MANRPRSKNRVSDYSPKDDGITHVNIYSVSMCSLGKMLSNFYPASIEHPVYGFFANVEAFWHFASTGFKHQQLRTMAGYLVKATAKGMPKIHVDNFLGLIKDAIRLKLEQHPEILEPFLSNQLPLDHYYVFRKGIDLIQNRPHGADELIEIYEELKQEFEERSS